MKPIREVSDLEFDLSNEDISYTLPSHSRPALLEWSPWIREGPPNNGHGCKGLDIVLHTVGDRKWFGLSYKQELILFRGSTGLRILKMKVSRSDYDL